MGNRKLTGPLPELDESAYRGQWVALDPETHRVAGHAHSLQAAKEAARRNGVVRPIVYGVPKSDGFFVGAG